MYNFRDINQQEKEIQPHYKHHNPEILQVLNTKFYIKKEYREEQRWYQMQNYKNKANLFIS